jgi:hypothetical protein
MRSSRVDEIEPSGWGLAECMVTESACQCQSRNSPGFDPSILRRSGIWGTADEALLNKVHTNRPIWLLLQVEWLAWIEMPKKFFKKKRSSLTKTEIYGHPNFCGHLLLLSRNFSRQAISQEAGGRRCLWCQISRFLLANLWQFSIDWTSNRECWQLTRPRYSCSFRQSSRKGGSSNFHHFRI